MSRELQATDQMGPRVVPRSLGPTVVGGGGDDGQEGRQTPSPSAGSVLHGGGGA